METTPSGPAAATPLLQVQGVTLAFGGVKALTGVGFDVQAVKHAGLSVGMRSMVARAERIGGKLEVVSSSSGTKLTVELALL